MTDRTKRNIVLPRDAYEELTRWHDSMSDPIYRLHSWGKNHFVSLEMIEEARDSLERHLRRIGKAVHRPHGDALLDELNAILANPSEHTAKAYGLEGSMSSEGPPGPGTRGWIRSGGLYRWGSWAFDASSPFSRGRVWRFVTLGPGSERIVDVEYVDNIDEANAYIARRVAQGAPFV